MIEWPGGTFRPVAGVASRMVSASILQGETYLQLPFVDDVRTVVDFGANCGAATCWFAYTYPDAQVWACEPATLPFALLTENAAAFANVHAERIGLHDHDATMTLYAGRGDAGSSSTIPSAYTTAESETIEVRAAGPWCAAHGIDRIDVLKVDTEGCEVPILRSLGPLATGAKVAYLEYHSEDDRRTIDAFFADTHVMACGELSLHSGEVTYLARSLDPPEAERIQWIKSGYRLS
jgi:FkbM family methyltransferase